MPVKHFRRRRVFVGFGTDQWRSGAEQEGETWFWYGGANVRVQEFARTDQYFPRAWISPLSLSISLHPLISSRKNLVVDLTYPLSSPFPLTYFLFLRILLVFSISLFLLIQFEIWLNKVWQIYRYHEIYSYLYLVAFFGIILIVLIHQGHWSPINVTIIIFLIAYICFRRILVFFIFSNLFIFI